MELELSQFEQRYGGLRAADPGRHGWLVSSMAREGQLMPVLAVQGEYGRFVLIDGHARLCALRELGRDLVNAVVLEMREPEALVYAWRQSRGRKRSALEDGWLFRELVERHGLSVRELARRLCRSASWVSRRLSLVRVLPEAAQQAVRRGQVPAHAAAKYLVVLARANRAHCARLVEGLGKQSVTERQLERLYLGWRKLDAEGQQKLLDNPWLYLRVEEAKQLEQGVPQGDPARPLLQDLEGLCGLSLRARRRLREGLLAELDERGRGLVGTTAKEAREAAGALFAMLEGV